MKKYKELISYFFWGVMTTLVNWMVYSLCVEAAGMNVNLGNIISWAAAVLFAFVTNKIWVFHSVTWKWTMVLHEFVMFIGARLLSGVVEIGGFALLIWCGLTMELFGVQGMYAKIIIAVIVVIMNYVLSKFLVFRKGHDDVKDNE